MPRKKKPRKSLPQELLVEGKNDFHVISALCQKYDVPETFHIIKPEDAEGIEAVLEVIPDKLNQTNLMTLGIVVDADENVAARWQAVTNKLQRFGYQNIPQILPEDGWIDTQEEKPKIGVWLMPNNKLPGMLEDFVGYLIPLEDKLKDKAEAILKQIEIENINAYSLTHSQKAFIHTWLAWQKTPGMPMGQAITAKALSNNSEIANIFITWLKRLFNT
ncbi:MAG: hypothetical protein QNJ55_25560 [Xenococcus sp. MO_188.B8]|nr:hypothetical protein [Xenococcus sp. MO_188.B8]